MNHFKIFLLLSVAIFCSNKSKAQPTLSSFSPKSGPKGTLVTITGTNFNAIADQNFVFFGAAKATILSATSTSIIVEAPPGATYEPITVSNNNFTAFSGEPFIITFAGGGSIDSASFTAKIDIPILPMGVCLAVGDLDGDGKTDIAYPTAGPLLSILRNTSTLSSVTFAPRIDFYTFGTPHDIKIGDLNGDGKPDIVIANSISSSFSVFKNNSTPGSISFLSLGTFRAEPETMTIRIGDVDGDGHPDVITVDDIARRFSIFRNTGENGSIAFAPKIDLLIDRSPDKVCLNDMDGDGKIDLIYQDVSSTVVQRNTSTIGNISFGEKTGLGVISEILSVGDIDGDGKADMVVTKGNNLGCYKNTSTPGSISFALPVNINAGITFNQTYFSDMDGDGKPDLVGFSRTSNNVYVLKNTSNAGIISFAVRIMYGTGNNPCFIAGAEIDGDGKPEMLIYNLSQSISILRNKIAEPTTIPSGTSPVMGGIAIEVFVDEDVKTYSGNPYVQRHYNVEPADNAGTSTATVTLYFKQEEFNNFNAHPAHGLALPTAPGDNAGKANLRVYQYHGVSTTNLPGSYSGGTSEINPDDSQIIWNDFLMRWEVTFDVTGFSGFFVSSSSNAALPLTLLSFDATVQEGNTLLQWMTTSEIGVNNFELQRGTDGINYIVVSKISAIGAGNKNTQYKYTDKIESENTYYYRLKIIDKDGSSKYSNVIKINSVSQRSAFTLYPNPSHVSVMVETPVVSNQSELRLIDMSGKLVKVVAIGKNVTRTKLNLLNIKPATYKILWTDGINSRVQTLMVE